MDKNAMKQLKTKKLDTCYITCRYNTYLIDPP